MKRKGAVNLTEGNVLKVLVTFSLPLMLSTVLQQVYNIADSMIVGKFSGELSLAAIGAAYPITLFFIAVATGASMGCAVVISNIYGSGRMKDFKCAVWTAIISLGVLGIIVSAAGIIFAGPLMHLLNAPDSIFANARAYLMIYSAGVLPMLLYNSFSGIFTGLGDSRTPLYMLAFSSVLNIILDLIAVRNLSLGVIGAAWATTISQVCAALLTFVFLMRRTNTLCPEKQSRYFDRGLLKVIASAAVPCILQQGSVALTHTIVQSILNTYDTSIIAGYEAASKLHNFAYMGMNTIGTAFASFTGQCYGAGKYERIKEGFRTSTLIILACTAVFILLFQFIPRQLIGLFVDETASELVFEAGVNFLRIISPVYIIICYIISTGGLLRGTGKSFTFFVETVAEFIVRVTMCFVLTDMLASYTGLMWAWYFGSTVGFILCLILSIRVFKGFKKQPS